MIIDERMSAFIELMDKGKNPFLDKLEQEALASDVPIIRRNTQSLLRFLISLTKPKRILEIGTAIGFSALLMSDAAPKEAHIDTIEKYEKRIPIAKENFEKATALGICGCESKDRITLLEGDAFEILPSLEGPYDLIFMDAAKGQYINWLPELMRLMPVGGLLISDNILQDGDILQSRYAVKRRDRTIHSRMRDYIHELTHNESLDTTVLPVGDGMTLSTKLK